MRNIHKYILETERLVHKITGYCNRKVVVIIGDTASFMKDFLRIGYSDLDIFADRTSLLFSHYIRLSDTKTNEPNSLKEKRYINLCGNGADIYVTLLIEPRTENLLHQYFTFLKIKTTNINEKPI